MKKTLILFTVLTALLYLIPLGVRDMFSPDETLSLIHISEPTRPY